MIFASGLVLIIVLPTSIHSFPSPSLVRARIGFVLLIFLAIVVGLLLSRGKKAPSGPGATGKDDDARTGGARKAAQSPNLPGGAMLPAGAIEEKVPVPPCWQDLMALDEGAS